MKVVYALCLAVTFSLLVSACIAPFIAGGIAATGMVANDRRTFGTVIEDQAIETKINYAVSDLFKEPDYQPDQAHINVVSYDRVVLLTGEVPSEIARKQVVEIANQTDNVAKVHDAIEVKLVSSLGARSHDTLLTSKVKSKLIGTRKTKSMHIKVVTESSVIYLMGLATAEESDIAAAVASETEGVERVVKLFQYIKFLDKPKDEPEDKSEDKAPDELSTY